MARFEVDEEVDVAAVDGFAAGNRTEHPHPRGTTRASNLDDLVASIAQLGQRHSGHRSQDMSDEPPDSGSAP